ncbi:MAG: phosphoribosylglycinamide formyltransferase [Euryarchaeota archaeon]|nr:phosphoribosylglycinamide formyltransferase [Euryarchaeota archaeon]
MAHFPDNHRTGSEKQPLRCAILISGSGTGMQALLRHQKSKQHCNHQTSLVISNNPDAGGIKIAEDLGIPVKVLPLPDIEDKTQRRLNHEIEITNCLKEYDIELIILSGYMRLLSEQFIENWNMKIVNIHPSLLPNFPGAHAHKEVLSAGVNISGCSVHYVDAGMDTGQIIAQRKVPVFSDDTIETLSQRVKIEEHILYPQVIDLLSS